jgi:hypothetical protein
MPASATASWPRPWWPSCSDRSTRLTRSDLPASRQGRHADDEYASRETEQMARRWSTLAFAPFGPPPVRIGGTAFHSSAKVSSTRLVSPVLSASQKLRAVASAGSIIEGAISRLVGATRQPPRPSWPDRDCGLARRSGRRTRRALHSGPSRSPCRVAPAPPRRCSCGAAGRGRTRP